jgi:hypothetical protein
MFSNPSMTVKLLSLVSPTSSMISHVSQAAPLLCSMMIPCLSLSDKISWRETGLKVTARKGFLPVVK